MSDNVARIIAGASAVFAASTMSISYATYHRVKPRLKVKTHYGVVTQYKPEGDIVSPSLTIEVRNHGQTAVNLDGARVEFRESYYRLLRKRLSGSRRSWRTWFPQLPDRATKDISAFGGVRWYVELASRDLKTLEKGGTHLRVGVELSSGIRVYGRWHRRPTSFPDSLSMGEDNGQLSFDDLNSTAATDGL
ncbi:hypothetical protein [Streptomyces sp. NPDC001893]|uniref:hypothetical protein n=1 Tax=Streptomyces sp. NPDC001893 TaxID=3154530 RepID=UPI0033206873